jgi:hypothetical protein
MQQKAALVLGHWAFVCVRVCPNGLLPRVVLLAKHLVPLPAASSLLRPSSFGFVFFLSDSTRFGVFAPCCDWLANLGI